MKIWKKKITFQKYGNNVSYNNIYQHLKSLKMKTIHPKEKHNLGLYDLNEKIP